MTRSERLNRTPEGLYRAAGTPAAPDSGVALDDGLVIRFSLDVAQAITMIDPGASDADLLAELFGASAAAALSRGAEYVEIELPRGWGLRAAARLAQASGLLQLPLSRNERYRWRAQAVVAAGDLSDLGFAAEEILAVQGAALLDDLERMGAAAVGVARRSRSLVAALTRLDSALGITAARRHVLDAVLDDLPDPDTDVMAQLAGAWPDAPSTVADQSPVRVEPVLQLTPEWLTADEQRLPLFWQLVREDLLPADKGFDGAVSVAFEGGTANIEVAAHPGSCEVLFVRIVNATGELRSVDVLRPLGDRWAGSIPIPEDFDRWSERFEVVDSLSRPVVADPDRTVADQHDLVRLAWDLLEAEPS